MDVDAFVADRLAHAGAFQAVSQPHLRPLETNQTAYEPQKDLFTICKLQLRDGRQSVAQSAETEARDGYLFCLSAALSCFLDPSLVSDFFSVSCIMIFSALLHFPSWANLHIHN
jgi:hypothetical protein